MLLVLVSVLYVFLSVLRVQLLHETLQAATRSAFGLSDRWEIQDGG